MQFIQPARNQFKGTTNNGLGSLYEVPDTINRLLRTACYDCHSSNTEYPWYTNIQPIGWILARHIRQGKADLNFDEFATYSGRMQRNKMKSIISQIRDDQMPLQSYTFMHKDARLSNEDKKLLINWFTK